MAEINGVTPDSAAQDVVAANYDSVFDHYQQSFQGLDHIVLHEFEGDGPLIHIHVVSPPDVNFRVLLTEGMSVVPMRTPAMNKRFLELSVVIPKEIHFMAETMLDDHPHRWIIEMLRYLAKFPSRSGAFLDAGHAVQAGETEYDTFGDGCPFSAAMILPSVTLWDSLTHFEGAAGEIRILSVMPLYPSELKYRLFHGREALVRKLMEGQVTELLDMHRPDLCPPEPEEEA